MIAAENTLLDANEYLPAPHAALPLATTGPSDLLRHALTSGADMATLERLMALQERYDANQARNAYVADMAEFKKNPPEIFKKKAVGYTNKDGSFTGYKHATLGDVTAGIMEGLAQHGFSHRWDVEQRDGGQIFVTCVLTHKLGHSERTTLNASRDDSGKKNNIQQVASTVTYLQRYTLLAATGLAVQDESDDDGHGATDPVPAEKTTARPYCTDEKFTQNKAAWPQIIIQKKKTPTDLIAFLSSKMELSEAQKLTIDSWSHETD